MQIIPAEKRTSETKRNVRLIAKSLYDYEQHHFNFYKKFTIKGFLAWQVIKRPLFYSLVRDSYTFKGEGKGAKTPPSRYLKALIKFPFSLIFLKIRKPRLKVFIMSSELVKYEKDSQGKDINNYADHWYSFQEERHNVYVENSRGQKDPENGVIQPDMDLSFISPLVRTLGKYILKFSSSKTFIKSLSAHLEKNADIENVGEDMYHHKINGIVSKFILDYYLYKMIFLILNPRILVVTDALGSGIMAAAKRAGMKIIENQHGHFDKYKPDYIMSHEHLGAVRSQLILPDKIAVFGPYFKKFLVQNSLWKQDEVVPVGNIRIDMYRTLKRYKRNYTNILIPSQWTVLPESLTLLHEIIKVAKYHPVKVILKLHPREPQYHILEYEKLAAENIEISIESGQASIYSLFMKSDLVIGFDSTSLYESVALEIPTITIATQTSPKGIHTFGDQDELLLHAIKTSRPENITEIIFQFISNPEFREEWAKQINRCSRHLYSINCDENCRLVMNDLKQSLM